MAKVEVYTKVGCSYCARAKALLQSKGVEFTEYDAAGDSALREQMHKRAPGSRTYPQVFIDDKLVGGSDDLMALDQKGGLDPMLAH